jgi:ubiquinone/menaquinone biosynthesis C-methylase UbiE
VSIRSEYDLAAADYDHRWARYNHASQDLLRPWVERRDLGRVVDVGCGTGNLLPLLRDAGGRVDRYAGIDLSPGMLRVARAKAGAADVRAEWITADAGRLPLRDAAFDTVVTASALHYWDDAAAGLAEIRRILRPDGRLLLVDWVRDPLPMRLLNLWMRVRGVEYRRMYSRAELRDALARAGFEVRGEVRGSAGGLWRLIGLEAMAV